VNEIGALVIYLPVLDIRVAVMKYSVGLPETLGATSITLPGEGTIERIASQVETLPSH